MQDRVLHKNPSHEAKKQEMHSGIVLNQVGGGLLSGTTAGHESRITANPLNSNNLYFVVVRLVLELVWWGAGGLGWAGDL